MAAPRVTVGSAGGQALLASLLVFQLTTSAIRVTRRAANLRRAERLLRVGFVTTKDLSLESRRTHAPFASLSATENTVTHNG
ncbi:MAG: hypothetical protein M3Y84_14415 [Acidobacteriota bacterium]|nr:hypothetical protein [Acidobacteriota bacterium]